MNPIERLQGAFSAANEGRHEEALREYIWFHDHALALEPALYGVRLSFALAYWVELGKAYPPAKAALLEVRDRKVRMLLAGQRDRELFHDVASINEFLPDEPVTAEVFAEIDKADFTFANQCASAALSALAGSGRFALARRYVPQPFETMGEDCARLNEAVEELPSEPASEAPRLEAYVHNYASRIRLLCAVLRGSGELEQAERLERAAVDRVDSPPVREAVRLALSSTG